MPPAIWATSACRLPLARGRDAADVAFITTFGPHTLRKFFVVTDEIK
jgi:hypothetical protein